MHHSAFNAVNWSQPSDAQDRRSVPNASELSAGLGRPDCQQRQSAPLPPDEDHNSTSHAQAPQTRQATSDPSSQALNPMTLHLDDASSTSTGPQRPPPTMGRGGSRWGDYAGTFVDAGLWSTNRVDFAQGVSYPKSTAIRTSWPPGIDGIAPDDLSHVAPRSSLSSSHSPSTPQDNCAHWREGWPWKRLSAISSRQRRGINVSNRRNKSQRAQSVAFSPKPKHKFSISSLPANWNRRLTNVSAEILGRDGRRSIVSRVVDAIFALPEEEPVNPARSLTKKELLHQRLAFGSVIFSFNVICIVLSAVGYSGVWVLCVILFFKSKDFLSVWIQVFCRLYFAIKKCFVPTPAQKASWILSLIPAYSESEEQIVKTLFSLRDNGTGAHRQVMCIILDGKPRPIRNHMTKIVASFERKYVSLKWKTGVLKIDAGFVDDIPTLCIEKAPNAGKKDSLVLCHDLFNYPRSNIDKGVLALREELWSSILPQLTNDENFKAFDLVFCTDADSTIHQGALALLADACLADPKAIAACGFVFVEYEEGLEWSLWNLYQQFQYSFGQIVRRGAEHYIGKVTCLPGCITMIVVRPEMAGAIEKYAKPVTEFPVLRHQVQYLGTDRRLTYSMLSQGKHLHTLFVPEAGSETVAPQSLKHYLSQRRRWGSNAYFNNFFYLAGANMILVTRIAALVEITRLSMVYYRVANTALFLYGVATHFSLIAILPLIAISFTPSVWFAFAVIFLNKHLRRNGHKLFCGFCINRLISPFMSITVFTLVARNLGSQVWGISGVTAGAVVAPVAVAEMASEEAQEEAAKMVPEDRSEELSHAKDLEI